MSGKSQKVKFFGNPKYSLGINHNFVISKQGVPKRGEVQHLETIGDGEFNSYLGNSHKIFPKILLGLPSLTQTQKKVAVSLFVCYGLFFVAFFVVTCLFLYLFVITWVLRTPFLGSSILPLPPLPPHPPSS